MKKIEMANLYESLAAMKSDMISSNTLSCMLKNTYYARKCKKEIDECKSSLIAQATDKEREAEKICFAVTKKIQENKDYKPTDEEMNANEVMIRWEQAFNDAVNEIGNVECEDELCKISDEDFIKLALNSSLSFGLLEHLQEILVK